MVSGVKSLNFADVNSQKQTIIWYMSWNADSESIKEIVNEAAVQAGTVVMMAFSDIDTGTQPATMQNQ